MSIKDRLRNLERVTGKEMLRQSVTWLFINGEPEPTEAQRAAVLAGLTDGNFAIYWKDGILVSEKTGEEAIPGNSPGKIHEMVIYAVDEKCREVTIRIMAGELESQPLRQTKDI
jgi:hypothetical protein